jgi:hypothetical protein
MLLQYFPHLLQIAGATAVGTAGRQSVLRRGGATHKKNGAAVKP